MGMLGWRGVGGAVMTVRAGTGEFKPELLQPDAVQKRALNTVTLPCAAGCTHATKYAALTDSCTRSTLSSRLMFPSSRLRGQDSLELSEVQKKKMQCSFQTDKSVHVATVWEYLTSGVLYSSTSQLGGKEQARKKGSKERHAYLSLAARFRRPYLATSE